MSKDAEKLAGQVGAFVERFEAELSSAALGVKMDDGAIVLLKARATELRSAAKKIENRASELEAQQSELNDLAAELETIAESIDGAVEAFGA